MTVTYSGPKGSVSWVSNAGGSVGTPSGTVSGNLGGSSHSSVPTGGSNSRSGSSAPPGKMYVTVPTTDKGSAPLRVLVNDPHYHAPKKPAPKKPVSRVGPHPAKPGPQPTYLQRVGTSLLHAAFPYLHPVSPSPTISAARLSQKLGAHVTPVTKDLITKLLPYAGLPIDAVTNLTRMVGGLRCPVLCAPECSTDGHSRDPAPGNAPN